MAEVSFHRVTKRFGRTTALADLDLTIADGEFIVLLGPTGAGKTTTLRLVAGLEMPDSGSVTIGGQDVTSVPPAGRDVAFVFQQYSLYPHLSVFDNLAFPLRSPTRRTPEDEVARVVTDVARMLRIDGKLRNRATELSGGQMQRVAIGRALVRRPAIYLMDEPLSSLDAKLRAELRVEIKHIQQDLGATILYVTHDQTEAMTLANRIGVINQGRLVQIGSPREIYEDPVDAYVAARLGSPRINLAPRTLFPDCAAPAATATIGIRTEHLAIRKANGTTGPAGFAVQGSARGTVSWIERLGDQSHLHVEIGETSLVSLVDPTVDLAVGDMVSVGLERPLFFDSTGQRVR